MIKMLSQVYEQVQNGWQFQPKGSLLAPFYSRRNELTIHQGCLLWGIRVVKSNKLQSKVLNLLHSTHHEIAREKLSILAGIDKDIEQLVKQCSGCQKQHNENRKHSCIHGNGRLRHAWEHVHVDFLGPFMYHD